MHFFNKRRNYFIEKKFQTKYMLLTSLMLFSYTLLFIAIIFAPYMLTLYLDYPLAEKAEAARALLLLHAKIWPWIGAIILTYAVVSIFISHKVAGPLFRLKRSLAMIAAGNLDIVIRLRKWDDLKDLAEHINLLTEELRTFIITLRNDYNLLSEYIVDLEHEIEARILDEEAGRELIHKVEESKKNIEAALKKFNIKP
jgi:methyl-accepting chemotaxis protein